MTQPIDCRLYRGFITLFHHSGRQRGERAPHGTDKVVVRRTDVELDRPATVHQRTSSVTTSRYVALEK